MGKSNPKPITPGVYTGSTGKKIRITQTWNPLEKELKPMDFFCVKGTGPISFGIRMVTRNLSPDRNSNYNHAGMLVDGPCSLEALKTLTTQNIFGAYEGCEILIARWNGPVGAGIPNEMKLAALKATNKHIGQIYPAHRILLHLFNLAHVFHWSKSLVCSEYVAKVLYKLGARHSKYYGTTPDNLADEVHRELNDQRTGPKYSIVYEGKLPFNFYNYCSNCLTHWHIPQTQFYCPNCHHPLSMLSNHCAYHLRKKVSNYNLEKNEFLKSISK